MDRSELDALLSTPVLRLLEQLTAEPSTPDTPALVTSLRKKGHPAAVVAAVVNQLSLRHKARGKFGDFASRMLFTKNGLEQATRLAVSSHHAGRFHRAGLTFVVDAGCGIGGDALACAGLGLSVRAIEQDPVTASLAAYNLAPFDGVEVLQGLAEEVEWSGADALWCDPARRSGSIRLSKPEDWSPRLDWVFDKATTLPTGIKLAPGMDRGLIPEGMEAQWVSYSGSVAEMVLWSGPLARENTTRSALVMSSRGVAELTGAADSTDADTGELGDYLIEPDGAVIRARLIGDLARTHGGVMLDQSIAYFSTKSPVHTPLAQCFRIHEVVPYNLTRVKDVVKRAHLGSLEIKKRGIDVDPGELRTHLSLTGEGEMTLILTRHRGKRVAILAAREDLPRENETGANQER